MEILFKWGLVMRGQRWRKQYVYGWQVKVLIHASEKAGQQCRLEVHQLPNPRNPCTQDYDNSRNPNSVRPTCYFFNVIHLLILWLCSLTRSFPFYFLHNLKFQLNFWHLVFIATHLPLPLISDEYQNEYIRGKFFIIWCWHFCNIFTVH